MHHAGVAIAGGIEPEESHALAKLRAGEIVIDDRDGIEARVIDLEFGEVPEGGREPGEIEGKTTSEGARLSRGRELQSQVLMSLRDQVVDRSEERRVGKECRSRWSPYH